MLGMTLALVVTVWIAVMLVRKHYAPGILLLGGLALITASVLMGTGKLIDPKFASGFVPFDIFESVRRMFATRTSGLGLQIMMIAGYSTYMDKIHASDALCNIFASPLKKLHSPMLVFALAFIITQFLSIFVPSGAGMALLAMITFYPILIRAGLSRLTALAVICSTRMFGWGPASPNVNFGCGLLERDVTEYFLVYQSPIVLFTLVFVLIAHLIVQPYWDRKEGPDLEGLHKLEEMEESKGEVPLIYAILPVLPLVLIMACSPLVTSYFGFPWKIKLNIANAMFMCTFLAFAFEIIHRRSFAEALKVFKEYFVAMGRIFTLVVCLIVAGEVFAKGLMMTGTLDTLVASAQSAGLGAKTLITACCLVTMISATLMGSGNAAFFSFAAMVPNIAASLDIDPVVMTVAIDEFASFGRTISPIFGAVIAVSSIAGVSPFQAAKRTLIPTLVGACVSLPFIFVYFGL